MKKAEQVTMQNESMKKENPLGTEPLKPLLRSLAIPAMIANVINALYNIVDQIFIGQGVGILGNAATSVSFPLTTLCMAIGLMVGLGSASGFNLELGRKREQKARQIAGTAAGILLINGLFLCILARLFLAPLLRFFGATEKILPFALTYAGITSLGIPFLLFSIGTNPLVRADGSPKYSMASIIIGAVLNTLLDPLFIFVFDWGIAGAAWATVISQILSAGLLFLYFRRFQSVHFLPRDFLPRWKETAEICKLGANSFIFQFSNLLVQVTLNNVLRTYGEASIYGADTPIAVAGIVIKINVIFIALIIGLINGAQPICSYNYGAGKYGRVRKTVRLFMTDAILISFISWAIFELFPQQLISLFGKGGDALYNDYAVRFMRIFLFCTFLTGMQICSSTFFPSIGKAAKGAIVSFCKQIVFLIPLLILLPKRFGLNGVMYAQPIADLLAFLLAMALLKDELKKMPKKDLDEDIRETCTPFPAESPQ